MSDAHKNFAYSTVATAPSPADSGTSLVVASGHGTKFPTVPFNATVWPAGEQPTTANAEIVRVTAISTDTLTIDREEESTTARTIVVGDQIAATITVKSLTDIETEANKKVCVTVGAANADYLTDGTDDDVQIQQALDSLPSTGGKVQLLGQTYIIGDTIIMDSNQRLEGVGKATVLKAKTSLNADIIYTQTATFNRYVEICNLAIDGNRDNNTDGRGIYLHAPRNCMIQGVWIKETDSDAIRFSGVEGTIGWYNWIIDSEIDNCDNGINILGYCEHNYIMRNTITFIEGNGVFADSDQDIIAYNKIDQCTGRGVHVEFGAGAFIIQNNTFDNGSDHDIVVRSAPKTIVSGNWFGGGSSGKAHVANGQSGSDASDNLIVTGNMMTESGGDYGIREVGGATDGCIYTDNMITGPTTAIAVDAASTNLTRFHNQGAANGDLVVDGSFVVNESGADKDTRIEGDTNANLVFVDASADRVGIGTNAPASLLDVFINATGNTRLHGSHLAITSANAGTSVLSVDANAAGRPLDIDHDVSNANWASESVRIVSTANVTNGSTFTKSGDAVSIVSSVIETSGSITDSSRVLMLDQQHADSTGTVLYVKTSGSGHGLHVDAGSTRLDGAVTINEDGNDVDTRIEGDTDANLVFVDASTDRVGIGTAAPGVKLHIAGASVGGIIGASVNNTDNTNAASDASLTLGIGGVSAGDPKVIFEVPSGTSWHVGVDNSASDRFRIGKGTAVGTDTYIDMDSFGGVKFPTGSLFMSAIHLDDTSGNLSVLGGGLDVDGDAIINGDVRIGDVAYYLGEIDNGNSSTADTINWSTSNVQKSTLTGNCTFTFTAPPGPCHLTLKLIQDATGSRTVTWPAAVKWSGGTAPTLTTTANKIDIVSFYYDGTNYYGAATLNF